MILGQLGWREATKKTIASKVVTRDFGRQMEGAKDVRSSDSAEAVIRNL